MALRIVARAAHDSAWEHAALEVALAAAVRSAPLSQSTQDSPSRPLFHLPAIPRFR
jgi:hypothetical protein